MRLGVGIHLWGWGRRIPPELAEGLRIPRSKPEWLGEALAVAAVVVNMVLVAVSYATLPQNVPTNFGFSGLPNSYGDKSVLLVLLGLNAFLCFSMTLASNFPRFYNFPVSITAENVRRQFLLVRYLVLAIKVLVSWLFCYMSYQIMAVALSRASAMGPGLWVFLALLVLGLPLAFVLAYKWK